MFTGNVSRKVIEDKSSIKYLKLPEDFTDLYVNSHLKDNIEYEGMNH